MIHSSNSDKGRLPVEEAMASARSALHALLAQFIQAAGEKGQHRVMFVSPDAGDGTTTMATSTALMLVRHFRRGVALVEANVYSPSMAGYLDITACPGILDVSQGSTSPEEAIRNSKLEGLYVLTAGGSRTPEEGELAAENVRDLISQASELCQFTIIDAPPILEHPEACLLLEHVDEVIMVVRAGETQRKRAEAAIQIIEDAGGAVSGLFINRYRSPLPFGLERFQKS